jgi:hypothetical protein
MVRFIDRLMLFRERIAVYCENRTAHTYPVYTVSKMQFLAYFHYFEKVQEVRVKTNRPLSFHCMLSIRYDTDPPRRPTVLLLLLVYSLPREHVY